MSTVVHLCERSQGQPEVKSKVNACQVQEDHHVDYSLKTEITPLYLNILSLSEQFFVIVYDLIHVFMGFPQVFPYLMKCKRRKCIGKLPQVVVLLYRTNFQVVAIEYILLPNNISCLKP